MQGIELSRLYYETYGAPMIEEKFSQYVSRIAVGLVGEGSECFGFDDSISLDHDFSPSFCMWLTYEDYLEIGEELQREYLRLPQEFQGYKLRSKSFGGENRRGAMTIGDFYERLIGTPGEPLGWTQWILLPQHTLATAVNGEVFRDDLGTFSEIRNTLKKGYPRDVRIKKLAAHLALMAQAGQYNFKRCLKHGEDEAAHLALYEFIKHTVEVLFLLSNQYAPFYKWQFRALSKLPEHTEIYKLLCVLIREQSMDLRYEMVEKICAKIVAELRRQGLSACDEQYLEAQALAVTEQIRDKEIRALHLMEFGA